MNEDERQEEDLRESQNDFSADSPPAGENPAPGLNQAAAGPDPETRPAETEAWAAPATDGERPDFVASSAPGYAGAADWADGPSSVLTRRRGGPWQRPLAVTWPAAIVLCLVLILVALGVGFAGGQYAAGQAVTAATADLEASIEKYFEEAGGTVLYRSVETDQETVSGAVDVKAVTDLAADSVVEILTQVVTDYGWFGRSLTPAAGSGVIISEDGYILTSNHVIEGAQSINISLRNGDQYEAVVVGQDAESDVAVLKIDAKGLTAAVLGNSDRLEVGSPAVVIGNPLGQLGGTVTQGIVSALDREITIGEQTYNLLQTDAAINSGNSGGGLFNARGELVGLVMAKSGGISVEGLGFAIPINDIKDIINDLINYGYVTSRVSLGVTLVNIDDERTANSYGVKEQGVYILKITGGGNAEYAGLQPGDRIISIDDTAIESADQVVSIIQGHSVGDTLSIIISRKGEQQAVSVTLYGVTPDSSGSEPTVTSAL